MLCGPFRLIHGSLGHGLAMSAAHRRKLGRRKPPDKKGSLGAGDPGKPQPFGNCEREGFVARSSGAAREANPYKARTLEFSREPPVVTGQELLADAWEKGWDAADRQLS